jgi:hypothetical protein
MRGFNSRRGVQKSKMGYQLGSNCGPGPRVSGFKRTVPTIQHLAWDWWGGSWGLDFLMARKWVRFPYRAKPDDRD